MHHLAFEVEPLQLNGTSPANFIVLGEKNATACDALICWFLNQLLHEKDINQITF